MIPPEVQFIHNWRYSTVTLLARFRGWSTSVPLSKVSGTQLPAIDVDYLAGDVAAGSVRRQE